MKTSDAIKKAMKTKSMRQGDVGERLGVNQSNISMWLRSDSGMRVENLLRMANICGYDLVLVDRSNYKDSIVIGESDTVDYSDSNAKSDSANDGDFEKRVLDIVNAELIRRNLIPEC